MQGDGPWHCFTHRNAGATYADRRPHQGSVEETIAAALVDGRRGWCWDVGVARNQRWGDSREQCPTKAMPFQRYVARHNFLIQFMDKLNEPFFVFECIQHGKGIQPI